MQKGILKKGESIGFSFPYLLNFTITFTESFRVKIVGKVFFCCLYDWGDEFEKTLEKDDFDNNEFTYEMVVKLTLYEETRELLWEVLS